MKNKIIALTLGTILALSSASAFAADLNTTNTNVYDCLKNYNVDYVKTYVQYTKPVETTQTTEDININNVPKQTNVNETKTTENTKTAETTAAETTKVAETTKTAETTKAAETETTNTVSSNVSFEEKVAQLVNVEREKNGLQPLVFDASISSVARAKSKDMADNNYFAHQSPTYGSAGNMLTNFGIKWSAWGENIASGQKTPEAVVTAWMNSEGHRANILSSNFGKIGIGYVTNSNGTPYWTQMFTN